MERRELPINTRSEMKTGEKEMMAALGTQH